MDEEQKIKLQNVVYRLRVINSKMEDLESSISSAKETVKRSLSINDKGVKEEILNDLCDGLAQSSKSIKGSIISDLNNKIYS